MHLVAPLPTPRPLLTGGGGTVLELLLGLATGITAALASRVWRHKRAHVDAPEADPRGAREPSAGDGAEPDLDREPAAEDARP